MSVRVHVGSILHGYTGGASELVAEGATLREVLSDLDRAHPGLLFRIVDEQGALRPHVKLYVGDRFVRELGTRVPNGATVHVLQALSGG
jgi:sulfur-carrier protein